MAGRGRGVELAPFQVFGFFWRSDWYSVCVLGVVGFWGHFCGCFFVAVVWHLFGCCCFWGGCFFGVFSPIRRDLVEGI